MRKSPQKIENPNNKKSLKAEIKDLLSLFQSSPNAEHEKDKKRKSIFNLLSAMDQNERKDVQVILDTIEKTIEELLGSRKYTDLFVKELNAQLQDDDANANLDNLKKSLGIQKINIHQDNYREVVEGIDMANLEKKEKSLIHNIFSQITIIFAKERMKNRPDRYCLFLKGVELKLLPLRPSDEELQAKKANFKLKDLKQRLRIADTEMNSENFSGGVMSAAINKFLDERYQELPATLMEIETLLSEEKRKSKLPNRYFPGLKDIKMEITMQKNFIITKINHALSDLKKTLNINISEPWTDENIEAILFAHLTEFQDLDSNDLRLVSVFSEGDRVLMAPIFGGNADKAPYKKIITTLMMFQNSLMKKPGKIIKLPNVQKEKTLPPVYKESFSPEEIQIITKYNEKMNPLKRDVGWTEGNQIIPSGMDTFIKFFTAQINGSGGGISVSNISSEVKKLYSSACDDDMTTFDNVAVIAFKGLFEKLNAILLSRKENVVGTSKTENKLLSVIQGRIEAVDSNIMSLLTLINSPSDAVKKVENPSSTIPATGIKEEYAGHITYIDFLGKEILKIEESSKPLSGTHKEIERKIADQKAILLITKNTLQKRLGCLQDPQQQKQIEDKKTMGNIEINSITGELKF